MPESFGFRLPHICLPRPGIDLHKWAVIACDQHTAEPAYWQQVAERVGDAPSALHLIFPEVHLGAPTRVRASPASSRRCDATSTQGLFVPRDGAVYVERTVEGRTRRGLMLELDLEHYDYGSGSHSLIRPTEGTMVARLAPRIEVRRGAPLELPHILVLIDDVAQTVIEPLAAVRDALPKLYDTELMLGGGHVSGRAVDGEPIARALQALHALADPQAFASRYGVAPGTPVMLFAMGDGNHSLATAKSIWEAHKATRRHGPPEPLGAGGGGQHPRPGARLRTDSPAAVRRGRRRAGGACTRFRRTRALHRGGLGPPRCASAWPPRAGRA